MLMLPLPYPLLHFSPFTHLVGASFTRDAYRQLTALKNLIDFLRKMWENTEKIPASSFCR